mmetsp:Transcript_11592/g.17549  ORF Transcript_11592/g.17549 Transcript_11592/m.17549 type:complete len:103 (+) Transcript_11592:987-1295(+)
MPLMQHHVDIFRHKVIMGIHNKMRRDKKGEFEGSHGPSIKVDGTFSDDHSTNQGLAYPDQVRKIDENNMSATDPEINHEIPIDDPTQVVLHKEMFIDITAES